MTWEQLCAHTIRQFNGEIPGAQLEADVRTQFEIDPDRVKGVLNRTAAMIAAGSNITSGWAVARAELNKHEPAKHSAAESAADQARHLERARQWMKNAGMHYDAWTEVEDELFGDRGMLRAYPHLKDEVRELWDFHRPTGEQLETEATERAEHWKVTQARLRELAKRPPAQPEPAHANDDLPL